MKNKKMDFITVFGFAIIIQMVIFFSIAIYKIHKTYKEIEIIKQHVK